MQGIVLQQEESILWGIERDWSENAISKNDLSFIVNYNLPIFLMFHWNTQTGIPSVQQFE